MKNILPVIFEKRQIRRLYNEETKTWFFSIIDIISAMQVTTREPRKYWSDLKSKLISEGFFELSEKIGQFKVRAEDGKTRETDCGDTETILRIIQSVPSPKAEPLKLWLAKVGNERLQEIADPEQALNRSREYWQLMGRSEKWIQQRMMGQETRNKLTDYWGNHGVSRGEEFAVLTNIIHEEWSDVSVQDHKNIKGLKTQNLRDHMSEAELIFTALAELSTRQIAENLDSTGFEENKIPARKGGKIAKDARKALEKKTGKSVVTGQNFLQGKNPKKLAKK